MDTKIKPGDKVTLGPGCRHERFRGRSGVAQRINKSRGVVRVQLSADRYDTYDALHANVQKEES